MTTAAVITAAGLSSRMGAFKPLLRLGDRSVIQHVIGTLRRSGIDSIAVVTGHCTEQLQRHLAGENVVFVHNGQYRTSEMFDSVKLGLSHWVDSCDRILFTPVDIPLFSAQTVTALLQTHAQAACPVCDGKQGHPLLLSTAAARAVLNDSGEDGLRGAVSRLSVPLTRVEVRDPGALYDADTPEAFARLWIYYAALAGTPLPYPSDSEAERILTEAGTPMHIQEHCRAVCEKALYLTVQAGLPADLGLLRSACLLHDLARAERRDHAAAAAELLTRRGYPVLAGIIAQHHDLSPDAPVEAELLYLADKLIRESDEVSLHERFAASREKCNSPDALRHWHKRYDDALRVIQRYHLDIPTGTTEQKIDSASAGNGGQL